MGDKEEDLAKLAAFDLVQHSNWKGRKMGYERLLKEVPSYVLEPEKLKKYCPLLKGLVTEKNELSRILASELALLIIDSAETKVVAKHVSAVVDGVITSCFSSKPKTKQNGVDCILQFIEHEKHVEVCAGLLEGVKNKNPKIVAASVETLNQALCEFGTSIIQLMPLFKELPKLFQHRDKNVRNATKDFFVEAYCWVGAAAVKSNLEKIPKIEQNIKECEDAWKDSQQKKRPTRFFKRLQAEKEAEAVNEAGDTGVTQVEAEEEPVAQDAWEYAPEIDVLSAINAVKYGEDKLSFQNAMASKKWKDRGDALDKLIDVLKIDKDTMIKLPKGDYISLVTDLKVVIKKDTNVLLISKALKIVKALADGMRTLFSQYGAILLPEIIARFKEKKVAVLEQARLAADAVALVIKFPDSAIDLINTSLEDKNPGVRAETLNFVFRNAKSKKVKFQKGVIKEFLTKVTKNVEHSDKNVREGSYRLLALMSTKLDGKIMNTFTSDFRDDRMKLLQDAKAELSKTTTEQPAATPSPAVVEAPKKQVPASAVTKKAPPKAQKVAAPKKVKKIADKRKCENEATGPPTESEMDELSAVDICNEIYGESTIKKVHDKNWKTRLEGLHELHEKLEIEIPEEIKTQAILKTLSLAPGFKDSNFQCNQEKFKIIKAAVQNPKLSQTSINIVFSYCLDKIADPKCSAGSKESLSSIADAVSLAYLAPRVLSEGNKLKSVKNVAECWAWFSEALLQFGFGKLDLKITIDEAYKALGNTNAAVRGKAVDAIAALLRYVPQLRPKFDDQKDAIKAQIDSALAKFDGPPPAPIRGPVLKTLMAKATNKDESESIEDADEGEDDLIPRTCIANSFAPELLDKLADKNWKMRKEALEAIKEIFAKNKFITSELGDLPVPLCKRLTDVNKVLVQLTFEIVSAIPEALGSKGARSHVRTFAVAIIGALNDSKPQIREKGISALMAWHKEVPLHHWFDESNSIAEQLADAKKVHLRYTFLPWLTEHLATSKKIAGSALTAFLPHLYSCLEDRDGKVREATSKSLVSFMIHLGFPKMVKACGTNQKVRLELEKAKEALPKIEVKAEVINAAEIMAPKSSDSPPPKKTKTSEEKSGTAKQDKKPEKKTLKSSRSSSKSLKLEPEDIGEIITGTEKAKEKRRMEDRKLKTLTWYFDPGTACGKELVDQLNKQVSACFGAKFAVIMHKSDSTAIGRVLDILQKEPTEKLTAVLDIVLRWMTIRLNEKNSTIMMRVLNYLHDIVGQLRQTEYFMSPFEAIPLLPHLISKLGESRVEVRSLVESILNEFRLLFPEKQIFEQLLQGAKSKNSRQRTECLTICAGMVKNSGIGVIGDPAKGNYKEIGAHISDKDQNVRSAAMNCLVEAYKTVGEELFKSKMVGKLGDKEESYLKERIKRSIGLPDAPASGSSMPVPKKGSETPRRGTVTIKKGAKPQPIKRDVPTVSQSTDTQHLERFGFKLPTSASVDVKPAIMKSINYEAVSKIARPPTSTSRLPKLEKEKEIGELMSLVEHFCLTESKMQELKAKLDSCDMNIFREGAKTLQVVFKESEKPLHLSDQELSGLIQPLTKNGLTLALNNIQQGNLRATQHVTVLCCNILHKILKQKLNCDRINAEDLRSVGQFLISILKHESAQEINQSIDNKFTSVLIQLIRRAFFKAVFASFGWITLTTLKKARLSDVNKHCKHEPVALMYLSLTADSLREEKLNQIETISNYFYKFFSVRNGKENLSENDISQIYFSAESFLKEFPKSREVFKKSPLYFNALRTVVTFATNLTRSHTEAVERFIVNFNPKKSNLLDLIKKEILKQKAKAVEEESLLNTFKKAVTKVKKVTSHDVGLEELHQFVIANPEFDVDAELSKEDEKFQNYIKNKLGNKKAGHEMTMISSVPPTASAIEQRARAMSEEYSLISTPSKALSKMSRLAEKAGKENVSEAAPASARAVPSKSTLEEYRKRLEQLRNAKK